MWKYLFFLLLIANPLFAITNSRDEILLRLNQWPEDFNNKKVEEVCGLFAPALIATYPGAKDRNYDQMCKQFASIFKDSTKTYRYEKPEIEQIIIDNNTAVVRLIWTLKVTSKDKAEPEITRERGLDVFTRQPDGSWKISVSYAYPEKN